MSADPRSKPVPPAWCGPISDWALWMAAASRSRATIQTRCDHIRRAARALGGSPWAVSPASLVRWCGAQTWSRETRRSVSASLKGFWGWAMAAGLVDANPAAALPRVAAAQPAPRPASDGALVEAVRRADARTRLVLDIAAGVGLRSAEIAQIHHRDLVPDLAGWSLVVHGKGGKGRLVPLGDGLARRIGDSCRAGGGWCFPGDDHGHLSPRYVGTLAGRVLPAGTTLHMLRHRWATRAYGATYDLVAVSQVLGHASLATTQRYVLSPDAARRAAVLAAA